MTYDGAYAEPVSFRDWVADVGYAPCAELRAGDDNHSSRAPREVRSFKSTSCVTSRWLWTAVDRKTYCSFRTLVPPVWLLDLRTRGLLASAMFDVVGEMWRKSFAPKRTTWRMTSAGREETPTLVRQLPRSSAHGIWTLVQRFFLPPLRFSEVVLYEERLSSPA